MTFTHSLTHSLTYSQSAIPGFHSTNLSAVTQCPCGVDVLHAFSSYWIGWSSASLCGTRNSPFSPTLACKQHKICRRNNTHKVSMDVPTKAVYTPEHDDQGKTTENPVSSSKRHSVIGIAIDGDLIVQLGSQSDESLVRVCKTLLRHASPVFGAMLGPRVYPANTLSQSCN